MMTVSVDTSAFRSWFHRAAEDAVTNVRQTFGQGVGLALAHAKATTSFKDGPNADLRKSITRGQRSTWVHFLKATAPHAKFIEYGTKDSTKGPIVAGGRALRFFWHGRLMFRRSVKHKGLKARHFMDDAATVGARFLDYRMEDAITRAFR